MRSHRKVGLVAYTLIEVLAALAFMAILLPVIFSALSLASRTGTTSDRLATATELGENRLNEMLINNAWQSEGGNGDFGEDWPGYRWEMTRNDWQTDTMTELALHVFFTVQGREHEVLLTTLVSDSVAQAQQAAQQAQTTQ